MSTERGGHINSQEFWRDLVTKLTLGKAFGGGEGIYRIVSRRNFDLVARDCNIE